MLWTNGGSGPKQIKPILTVTAAASSYNLVTRTELKTYLGISGSSEDTALDTWIAQASGAIASYCNRVFPQETVSEQFRMVRGEAIILGRYPVVSITSVTEDGTVLVNLTDYEVDKDTGLLYRVSDDLLVFWCAYKVTVVYVTGFATIPDDVKRACMETVRYFRSQSSRDPTLRSLEIPDVSTETYWVGTMPSSAMGLPPDVISSIESYVVRRVN